MPTNLRKGSTTMREISTRKCGNAENRSSSSHQMHVPLQIFFFSSKKMDQLNQSSHFRVKLDANESKPYFSRKYEKNCQMTMTNANRQTVKLSLVRHAITPRTVRFAMAMAYIVPFVFFVALFSIHPGGFRSGDNAFQFFNPEGCSGADIFRELL